MIPKSISASSLDVASKCLAAYKASAVQKGSSIQNPAAMLGTALHAAIENFTAPHMIAAKIWDWNILDVLWRNAYSQVFNSPDEDNWFQDGRNILRHWFDRSYTQDSIYGAEIISREQKSSFDVPCIIDGQKSHVAFNFIMDRLDQTGEDEYRVVDYKSQRAALSPADMYVKIQPRAYALATQIMYPDAQKIWVSYDFLRYDSVEVMFSRDDNVNTWGYLKRALQRIIDTPIDNPPETLNENCRYCVRKLVCGAFNRNITVGGIFSFSVDELAERYYKIKSQLDAMKSALDETELEILTYAQRNEIFEWETDHVRVKVGSKSTRYVDQDKMREILGDLLYGAIGKVTIAMMDDLRGDGRLTNAQRSLLDTAIMRKQGDPYVRTTPK